MIERMHARMHVYSARSDSLWPHRLQPARLLCPWDFPGKNTGGISFAKKDVWGQPNNNVLFALQLQQKIFPDNTKINVPGQILMV